MRDLNEETELLNEESKLEGQIHLQKKLTGVTFPYDAFTVQSLLWKGPGSVSMPTAVHTHRAFLLTE